MNALAVDVIKDFIGSLDLSSRILSLSNDGAVTTIDVENPYHARKDMTVDIDGSDYTVVSSDAKQGVIVIDSVLLSGEKLTVPTPFFKHGTYIKANNELNDVRYMDEKTPLIFLEEVFHGVLPNPSRSGINDMPQVFLFFMDKSPENGDTTENQYDNIVQGLWNLSIKFRESMYDYPRFGMMGDIKYAVLVEWGKEFEKKGNVKRFLDMHLTGVVFSFKLPILKCCD